MARARASSQPFRSSQKLRLRAVKRAVSSISATAGAIAAQTALANSQFARDLNRARWDVDFFAERFLGVTGHPGQTRLWKAVILRDESGYRPRYLTITCAAGNRAGKTLGLAIAVFHSTFFKIGLRPPNIADDVSVRRWLTTSYDWYHFAIAQETAELVYIEITRLLLGTHEAQKNGCPLTTELGKDVADWTKKYRGEYLWIRLHEALGGGEIHFRTTGEKALGSLGKDMHGISYDEAAFDPHFPFVINEVLHFRRLSTGGQMILIGTATEGLNDFADKWEEGNPEAPDKLRDSFSLRISTRENIGYGIDPKTFDRLLAQYPPELIPQNIDGLFIQGRKAFFSSSAIDASFDADLPTLQSAERGHRYVVGVDPATTLDSTWVLVLDVTKAGFGVGVKAIRSLGRTTGPTIASLATDAHNSYQTPHTHVETGIDATGFGGKVFRDLLAIQPLRSIEFGGTRGKKLKLLNDLRGALERGALKFPRSGTWLALRRQLIGYKLEDRNIEQDAVMALAVAVSLMLRTPSGSQSVVPFDFFGVHSAPTAGGPPLPEGSHTFSIAEMLRPKV